MSIGVSADRAGDGLFMASLMRAIIQKSPRTRDKVYKEDETMVQEKNSFQRQRDRAIANLLPAPPVVASESQGVGGVRPLFIGVIIPLMTLSS